MRVLRVILATAATTLLGFAAVASLPAADGALETPSAAEVARIQRHLGEVERELLARDVSQLSDAARAARAEHIAALREYRARGVFPHNHVHAAGRVPVFIDEHGTHCAVGYLIARSGRPEMARRIAATNNLATVPGLADDAELIAWLDGAGLSLAEAARIQPWYEPQPPATTESNLIDIGYAAASALTASVGGAALALNWKRSEQRWPAVLGIAAGVTGIALGAGKLDDGGDVAPLGAFNAGLGAVTAAVGAWRLIGPPAAIGGPARAAAPTLDVAPLVSTGGASRGIQLRLRF